MTANKTLAPLAVLVLDDDFERMVTLQTAYDALCQQARDGKWALDRKISFIFVSTLGAFAEELAKRVFDVVVLDHDLGLSSFTHAAYNGQIAAAMLAGVYASSHRPKPSVVVWSHNPDGARAIRNRLAVLSDFQVEVAPHDEQLCTRLCHQWTTTP
jgi:hypothetical protein